MNSDNKYILAIETSFDETAVAISRGRCIVSSVLTSSTNLHKKWGGVVPDIARRAHIESLPLVYKEALKRARMKIEDIDIIAVTYGPGLAIELEVGISFAKELAIKYRKPLLPVDHMEGHLLSSFILNSKCNGQLKEFNKKEIFPALALLISGNHTELVLMNDFGQYRKVGETLDDAVGEAFDKVGRMLEIGFPGGPIVSMLAKKGDPNKFELPIPMLKSPDLNFSFSGLKTACLYKIRELKESKQTYNGWVEDFCSSFVQTVIESLRVKTVKAIKQFKPKTILIGGGVVMNSDIIRSFRRLANDYNLNFYYPEKKYRTDNAGMIAVAGYYDLLTGYSKLLKTKGEIKMLDRKPRLEIGSRFRLET